jgi:hypothetical protein
MRLRWLAVPALAAVAWSIEAHPWGWLYGLGVHPYPASSSTPWSYQLWSGIVPSLTVVTLIGAVVGMYRAHTCHVDVCWRLAKYPAAGGQYRVCRRHHPDDQVRGGVTARHVQLSHDSWKQAAGR